MKSNTDIIQYKDGKCIVRATNDNMAILKRNILKNIKTDNFVDFISEITVPGHIDLSISLKTVISSNMIMKLVVFSMMQMGKFSNMDG
ncbi:MAG: hypothetical protein LBK13_00295 [Spirochaetales bacterium]|jgi:hypothetical protein|nr:hypothetical protein [Spirochaetales bacterium]